MGGPAYTGEVQGGIPNSVAAEQYNKYQASIATGEQDAKKERDQTAKGRASTMLTGGGGAASSGGLMSPSYSTARKTLLGA